MIQRTFVSVSSAATPAHRGAISPERHRVTRPVRPATADSELAITLAVARHLRKGFAHLLDVNLPAFERGEELAG